MLGRFICCALTLVLLAACAREPLEGVRWNLVSLDGRVPLEGRAVTLHFSATVIDGDAGCNAYGGRYEVDGERVRFPKDSSGLVDIWSTAMGCESEALMRQEEEYLRTLRQVATYRIAGDQLELLDDKGEPVLMFEEAG